MYSIILLVLLVCNIDGNSITRSTNIKNVYIEWTNDGISTKFYVSSKLISDNFAFRGTFLASAPLCNHSLTQSDLYLDANANATFGYNVNSVNQLRQHFVGHLDLEAVFQSQFGQNGSIEFVLSWHVKQYINQSYLTAMLNNQNASPSTIQVNMLRAGLVFIF